MSLVYFVMLTGAIETRIKNSPKISYRFRKDQSMKIILVSVGTRGDMEPFLAIGKILKEKDCQVICAFPEQFRDLADDAGLTFASLGEKYVQMLDSDDGKIAIFFQCTTS